MRKRLLTAGCAVAAALTVTAAGSGRAAAGAPLGAAAGATVNPCTATAAYADEVSDAGQVVWQASLPSGQAQAQPSPVEVKGVAVFAGAGDLTGLRAGDGHRLWDIHIQSRPEFSPVFTGLWAWDGSAVTLIDYSGTDWRVVAVNPATGKVRWQVKFGAQPDAEPVLDSTDGVLALAAGRYVYALSLTSGPRHLLWSRKFIKPDPDGNYSAELAITSQMVVADYVQDVPPTGGVLAGFLEKSGAQLWARTGIPQFPSLDADGGIVYLSGVNQERTSQLPRPLKAISVASGKTLWQASVGYLYNLWTAPGQVVFGSRAGLYDVNPATGAKRWKVPGENATPNYLLLTATDVIYYPGNGDLTDRKLSDGAVAWTQPAATTEPAPVAIVTPGTSNALVAASNNFDDPPQTKVYTVSRSTGKLAAATLRLPSDLAANPAVTGSDVLYQLAPEACESA